MSYCPPRIFKIAPSIDDASDPDNSVTGFESKGLIASSLSIAEASLYFQPPRAIRIVIPATRIGTPA